MEMLAVIYLIALIFGLTIGSMLTVHSLGVFRYPGGLLLFFHLAAITITLVGYFMMAVSASSEQAFFWARVRVAGLSFATPFFLIFVLDYQDRRPPGLPLLHYVALIVPIVTMIMIWNDSTASLFFESWTLERFAQISVERIDYGVGFQIYGILNYILLCVAYYYIVARLAGQRTRLGWFLLGNLLGTLGSFTTVMIGNSLPVNVTPIFLSMGLIAYGWGLFRGGLYNAALAAWHTVFTSLQDAVVVIDRSDRIMQWNEAARALLSRRVSALINKPLSEVLAHYGFARVVPSEMEARFEMTLEGRVFDARLSAMRLSNGYVAGRVLVLRDISAVMSAQEAAVESTRRYDALVENIPAFVYQIRRTPDGVHHVDYISPGVRKYNKLEPKAVIADPWLLFNQIPADDLKQLEAAQDESARNLTPMVWEGRAIVEGVTQWARTEAIPSRLDDGGVVWNGIRMDITAHKNAEIALERSRRLIERIAQLIPDTLHIYDLTGPGLIYFNRPLEPLVGYSVEEIQSMQPGYAEVLMHPDDYAIEQRLTRRYAEMRDDEIIESEYRWQHKTRGMIWINTRKMVYERGSDGKITQILSIMRDVTDRKTAEEQRQALLGQLQAANQELKDFAYVISHDLKAPLRGVSAIAQWLVDEYADMFGESGKELIDLLGGRVQRMEQMINGVLEYSRIGRDLESRISVDLNRMLAEIIQDIVPADRFQVTVETTLPTLLIEPTRIRQVFQNLIDNAVKFMDKPMGEIRIAHRRDETSWRFSVQDNGPGIAPEHFARIFVLFQTLESTGQPEDRGMGLSIAKRIVEFYSGRIWVESTLGEGATFIFTLPVAFTT
ncbi:MAG: PAS domain S-box protein [Anaerolineae bacterium]|nr:PAS domain S-box protein [Anaerolineae bacterium]